LIGVERSEERRPDGRDHKEHAHTAFSTMTTSARRKRLAMRGRRRMVASINNMTQAVKRRLKDIHLF
jgi:hypothetical protein